MLQCVCVRVACLGSVKLLRRPIRVAIAGLDLRRGGIQSNATDTCTRTILVQLFLPDMSVLLVRCYSAMVASPPFARPLLAWPLSAPASARVPPVIVS